MLTTGHGAHLYDPQTVRASVGSLFALPVVPVGEQPSADRLGRGLAHAMPRSPSTPPTSRGTSSCDRRTSLARPAILLLGTERTGLARALRDLADVTLAIPMAGSASSLNVAVAHGIVLHTLMSTVTPHG